MGTIPGNKIKRIVIWGLKKKYHTHRHIHQAFYKNAKKLNYPTLWLEDEKKNQKYIQPGDLIITAEVNGKMVPEKKSFEDYNMPVREDIFYCLHNVKDVFKKHLNPKCFINLQVYDNSIVESPSVEKWDLVRFFNKETKTLYQPWGTNLLYNEFKKPVFNKNKFVFWIGSIWNDKLGQGNITEIQKFKDIILKKKFSFIQIRFVPDFLNIFFTRISRISPAIAGKYQTEIDYLPCRMFKNISYGQLGFSNVKKFNDILGKYSIYSENMEEMIEKVLSLSEKDHKDMVIKQQEIIGNYTYKQAIENIIKAINQI